MNWHVLSEYRNLLFGISIIAVMLHNMSKMAFEGTIARTLLAPFFYGKGGVDVFLFLSALGLYFSYRNNPRYGAFLKRRFACILPAFLIVAILETAALTYLRACRQQADGQ